MANLGRLHLAVATSHSAVPAQTAGVWSRCRVVLPLREFKIALETLSQNFIIAWDEWFIGLTVSIQWCIASLFSLVNAR